MSRASTRCQQAGRDRCVQGVSTGTYGCNSQDPARPTGEPPTLKAWRRPPMPTGGQRFGRPLTRRVISARHGAIVGPASQRAGPGADARPRCIERPARAARIRAMLGTSWRRQLAALTFTDESQLWPTDPHGQYPALEGWADYRIAIAAAAVARPNTGENSNRDVAEGWPSSCPEPSWSRAYRSTLEHRQTGCGPGRGADSLAMDTATALSRGGAGDRETARKLRSLLAARAGGLRRNAKRVNQAGEKMSLGWSPGYSVRENDHAGMVIHGPISTCLAPSLSGAAGGAPTRSTR